jgi:hypothetical protein
VISLPVVSGWRCDEEPQALAALYAESAGQASAGVILGTISLDIVTRVWLTIGVIRVLSRKGDIGCNFPLHFYVFPFISIELGEKKMCPGFLWG